MRKRLSLFAMVAVAALAVGFLLGRPTSSSGEEPQPQPMPLVLERVQALGELHTARYTYQNVFEHRTSRRPEAWTQYVPGVPQLVTASTRNSALLGVTGYVEAGIDLSQARVEDDALILPAPKVYRPHVDAKVHRHRAGMFWSDPNIALKAVGLTEARLKTAAVEQGILEQAKSNAEAQLLALLPEVARYRIVFEDSLANDPSRA
jgi:hypothetical protein